MSDDDLRVRDPDEAPDAPEPAGKRAARWVRDLALGLAGAAALFVFVGWLRAPELPDAAPPLSLPALTGETVSLADLRGKTVVLNFWATWCGPCKLELPTLTSFAEENPDVPVLFVAVDGKPEALRAFAEANDMPLDRVLVDTTGVKRAYSVSTLPTTVVVGPDGDVRGAHAGIILGPQLAWMTR
ncbi:MAG: TlpA family protein disulfide reductase [Myxococcota bacterium]